MSNLRKQTIADINMMENRLIHHQATFIEHKTYLKNMLSYKSVVLIATVLPAFIVGWDIARMNSAKHALKRLIKFGALTAMTRLRKNR